ncbi:hypothetical protein [Glutamicibacter soli]
MIVADTITCRVPSETALKINELYCAVANPVASADSQTWASWAGVVVSLIAAGVTLAAVLVAMRQAGDARIIAQNSNKEAINRELMARQWDRYEHFSRETVLMMQHLGAEPNDYAALMTNQTHAGNAYVMYLSLEHPKLSDVVTSYSDALQAIGSTINALNTATVAKEEFDASVVSWANEHPRLQKECMQSSALIVNELRSFYQKKKSAEVVTSDLEFCLQIIVEQHLPLLRYYEKDLPAFMRKYSH